MEELGTTISNFLRAHWQWVLIVIGVLLILGSIFNWSWVTDMSGSRTRYAFTSGSGCSRIFMGIIGFLLAAGGVVALVFF